MSYFVYTPYDRTSNIGATLTNINDSFTGILAGLVDSVKALTPDVVVSGGTVTAGTFPAINIAATQAIITGNYHTIGSGSVTAVAGNNAVTYVYITSSGVYGAAGSVPSGGLPLALVVNNSGGTDFATITDIRVFYGSVVLPNNGVTVLTANSYVFAQTDRVVISNPTSAGAVAITLPANPIVGKEVGVKDAKGDSFSNNITVSPGPGASTIDGASNFVINSNLESAWFIFNGTDWSVI